MEFNFSKLREMLESFPIGECLNCNTIGFTYDGETNAVDLCMFAAHLERILYPIKGKLDIKCQYLGGYYYEVNINKE